MRGALVYLVEANILFWASYVDDLSVKKQDKALIHAKRARNIRTVLIDPKDTAVESAQFRYKFLFLDCQIRIILNKVQILGQEDV